MPNYKYECTSCQHEMDAYQSIKEDNLIVCPKCEAKALVKVIGAPFLKFNEPWLRAGQRFK